MKAGPDRLAGIPTQPSSLLPALFDPFEEGQRLTVLHVGSAQAETVEFFSRYRSRLHFLDLFAELPIQVPEDASTASLQQAFADLDRIPAGHLFDICLFWDVFNFLDADASAAMMSALRPRLHADSLGHAFAVHNLRTPQSGKSYGIRDRDRISVRERPGALPGYKPCNQGQLEKSLDCFAVTRSVLLPDSRLEVLLRARRGGPPRGSLSRGS